MAIYTKEMTDLNPPDIGVLFTIFRKFFIEHMLIS